MDISVRPDLDVNNVWFEQTDSDAVLVFVHGVLSCSRTCWLHEEKGNLEQSAYWPDLISKDPRFGNIAMIFLGGYETSQDSGDYEVWHCADELFGSIGREDTSGNLPPLNKHKITFVCH